MLKWYCLVSLDRRTVTSAVGWLQLLSFSSLYLLSCCFPSQTETLVFTGSNISFGTSGSSVFHFLLTSNQPVFVFSSHSCVHTTWSENTLLSQLVNMLFLIYYLLPMGCISECTKQLFWFCSHNHVEKNHRARCLALVLQHLCFPLSLCKIHPSLFYLFPRFHRLNN